MNRPLIGVTLDAEPAGGWSRRPWYALRENYFAALSGAGALPVALPHEPELAGAWLDRLDGLVITGGAFDIDPALYGEPVTHLAVTLKVRRTDAELALLGAAMARGRPVLGICGGQQLLAVALGGTLAQHIPDEFPNALAHEQTAPPEQPTHDILVAPGTTLHAILGVERMAVNTSHHQAVRDPGRATVSAVAPDGVIEAIELADAPFCLGVQWHPEYLASVGDRALFDALVAACRR